MNIVANNLGIYTDVWNFFFFIFNDSICYETNNFMHMFCFVKNYRSFPYYCDKIIIHAQMLLYNDMNYNITVQHYNVFIVS